MIRIVLRSVAQELGLLLGLAMICGAVWLSGCAGGGITLSQAAQAACKGQSAANIATDVAASLDRPEVALASAGISAALGVACKW